MFMEGRHLENTRNITPVTYVFMGDHNFRYLPTGRESERGIIQVQGRRLVL